MDATSILVTRVTVRALCSVIAASSNSIVKSMVGLCAPAERGNIVVRNMGDPSYAIVVLLNTIVKNMGGLLFVNVESPEVDVRSMGVRHCVSVGN